MSTTELVDRNAPARAWPIVLRGAVMTLLLLFEISQLDANYSFRAAIDGEPTLAWRLVNDTLQAFFYAGFYAAIAFCVIAFARQRSIAVDWIAAARAHRWLPWLGAQLALFALILAALPVFAQGGDATPWGPFALWLAACAALFACWTLALAPLAFWRALVQRNAASLLVAAAAGALTWGAVELSQNSWHQLAAATLHTSYWLLSLFEPTAFIDASQRLLGAGEFRVVIDAPCSGYEGIGLVLVMMSLYIFAFRGSLRFPHVLALLPLGALTIWLLNTVRLAALVSLGAHVSPSLALDGFHSQAGWVMFLAVTITLMVVAHRSPLLRTNLPPRAKAAADPALTLAAALLTPFAVLMGARIGAAMFGETARWAGPVLGLAPLIPLWLYRDAIRAQLAKINPEPMLIGLAVGVLWIATQPVGHVNLGHWLADLPPGGAALWLALRLAGFVLIVPIAEELVFRGYLHRALIARRFETAPPAAFGLAAFLVTSLLFGALHGRWLAGALAGAAFAIALYRSKTITGPIVAHVAANGLIAFYALATERWDLI